MGTKNIGPVATCKRCGWQLVAASYRAHDVASVTVRLEDHLSSVHGVADEEANEEAQAWGLRALRGDAPVPDR